MERRRANEKDSVRFACFGNGLRGDSCPCRCAYTPGTYTVSVDGHNGEICLAVEMTADAIASIKVLSHSETTGLGDAAMDKVIAAIVAANNADVDAVASATVSSNAVIKA